MVVFMCNSLWLTPVIVLSIGVALLLQLFLCVHPVPDGLRVELEVLRGLVGVSALILCDPLDNLQLELQRESAPFLFSHSLEGWS